MARFDDKTGERLDPPGAPKPSAEPKTDPANPAETKQPEAPAAPKPHQGNRR
jgi:hypothetical protein